MPTLYSMVTESGNRNRNLKMCKFQFWLVHWIDPRSIKHSYACYWVNPMHWIDKNTIFTLNFYEFSYTMYIYVLNSVVKISLMFAQYFEYYAIILRERRFLWTRCIIVMYNFILTVSNASFRSSAVNHISLKPRR